MSAVSHRACQLPVTIQVPIPRLSTIAAVRKLEKINDIEDQPKDAQGCAPDIYLEQAQELSHQIQNLQSQLQQAGQLMQIQHAKQKSSTQKLQNSLQEISILKNTILQKDKLFFELGEKMNVILNEYVSLKHLLGISRSEFESDDMIQKLMQEVENQPNTFTSQFSRGQLISDVAIPTYNTSLEKISQKLEIQASRPEETHSNQMSEMKEVLTHNHQQKNDDLEGKLQDVRWWVQKFIHDTKQEKSEYEIELNELHVKLEQYEQENSNFRDFESQMQLIREESQGFQIENHELRCKLDVQSNLIAKSEEQILRLSNELLHLKQINMQVASENTGLKEQLKDTVSNNIDLNNLCVKQELYVNEGATSISNPEKVSKNLEKKTEENNQFDNFTMLNVTVPENINSLKENNAKSLDNFSVNRNEISDSDIFSNENAEVKNVFDKGRIQYQCEFPNQTNNKKPDSYFQMEKEEITVENDVRPHTNQFNLESIPPVEKKICNSLLPMLGDEGPCLLPVENPEDDCFETVGLSLENIDQDVGQIVLKESDIKENLDTGITKPKQLTTDVNKKSETLKGAAITELTGIVDEETEVGFIDNILLNQCMEQEQLSNAVEENSAICRTDSKREIVDADIFFKSQDMIQQLVESNEMLKNQITLMDIKLKDFENLQIAVSKLSIDRDELLLTMLEQKKEVLMMEESSTGLLEKIEELSRSYEEQSIQLNKSQMKQMEYQKECFVLAEELRNLRMEAEQNRMKFEEEKEANSNLYQITLHEKLIEFNGKQNSLEQVIEEKNLKINDMEKNILKLQTQVESFKLKGIRKDDEILVLQDERNDLKQKLNLAIEERQRNISETDENIREFQMKIMSMEEERTKLLEKVRFYMDGFCREIENPLIHNQTHINSLNNQQDEFNFFISKYEPLLTQLEFLHSNILIMQNERNELQKENSHVSGLVFENFEIGTEMQMKKQKQLSLGSEIEACESLPQEQSLFINKKSCKIEFLLSTLNNVKHNFFELLLEKKNIEDELSSLNLKLEKLDDMKRKFPFVNTENEYLESEIKTQKRVFEHNSEVDETQKQSEELKYNLGCEHKEVIIKAEEQEKNANTALVGIIDSQTCQVVQEKLDLNATLQEQEDEFFSHEGELKNLVACLKKQNEDLHAQHVILMRDKNILDCEIKSLAIDLKSLRFSRQSLFECGNMEKLNISEKIQIQELKSEVKTLTDVKNEFIMQINTWINKLQGKVSAGKISVENFNNDESVKNNRFLLDVIIGFDEVIDCFRIRHEKTINQLKMVQECPKDFDNEQYIPVLEIERNDLLDQTADFDKSLCESQNHSLSTQTRSALPTSVKGEHEAQTSHLGKELDFHRNKMEVLLEPAIGEIALYNEVRVLPGYYKESEDGLVFSCSEKEEVHICNELRPKVLDCHQVKENFFVFQDILNDMITELEIMNKPTDIPQVSVDEIYQLHVTAFTKKIEELCGESTKQLLVYHHKILMDMQEVQEICDRAKCLIEASKGVSNLNVENLQKCLERVSMYVRSMINSLELHVLDKGSVSTKLENNQLQLQWQHLELGKKDQTESESWHINKERNTTKEDVDIKTIVEYQKTIENLNLQINILCKKYDDLESCHEKEVEKLKEKLSRAMKNVQCDEETESKAEVIVMERSKNLELEIAKEVEAVVKCREYDLEEKFASQLRKREAEIQEKCEAQLEKVKKEFESYYIHKFEAYKTEVHQQFLVNMQKIIKDCENKIEMEVERQKLMTQGKMTASHHKNSDAGDVKEVMEQLHKENTELAEARDALLKEVELSKIQQHEIQEDAQSYGSDNSADEVFIPEDLIYEPSMNRKISESLMLDWELKPQSLFDTDNSLDFVEHFESKCNRPQCDLIKQRYLKLCDFVLKSDPITQAKEGVYAMKHGGNENHDDQSVVSKYVIDNQLQFDVRFSHSYGNSVEDDFLQKVVTSSEFKGGKYPTEKYSHFVHMSSQQYQDKKLTECKENDRSYENLHALSDDQPNGFLPETSIDVTVETASPYLNQNVNSKDDYICEQVVRKLVDDVCNTVKNDMDFSDFVLEKENFGAKADYSKNKPGFQPELEGHSTNLRPKKLFLEGFHNDDDDEIDIPCTSPGYQQSRTCKGFKPEAYNCTHGAISPVSELEGVFVHQALKEEAEDMKKTCFHGKAPKIQQEMITKNRNESFNKNSPEMIAGPLDAEHIVEKNDRKNILYVDENKESKYLYENDICLLEEKLNKEVKYEEHVENDLFVGNEYDVERKSCKSMLLLPNALLLQPHNEHIVFTNRKAETDKSSDDVGNLKICDFAKVNYPLLLKEINSPISDSNVNFNLLYFMVHNLNLQNIRLRQQLEFFPNHLITEVDIVKNNELDLNAQVDNLEDQIKNLLLQRNSLQDRCREMEIFLFSDPHMKDKSAIYAEFKILKEQSSLMTAMNCDLEKKVLHMHENEQSLLNENNELSAEIQKWKDLSHCLQQENFKLKANFEKIEKMHLHHTDDQIGGKTIGKEELGMKNSELLGKVVESESLSNCNEICNMVSHRDIEDKVHYLENIVSDKENHIQKLKSKLENIGNKSVNELQLSFNQTLKEKDAYIRTLEEHFLQKETLTSINPAKEKGENQGLHGKLDMNVEDSITYTLNDHIKAESSPKSSAANEKTSLIMTDKHEDSNNHSNSEVHTGTCTKYIPTNCHSEAEPCPAIPSYIFSSGLDLTKQIIGGIGPDEGGHATFEKKPFELIDEISQLRRELRETKEIYTSEIDLLSDSLEKFKASSTVGYNPIDIEDLKKHLFLIEENNRSLQEENDSWLEKIQEQELIVANLTNLCNQGQNAAQKESEIIFGQQISLLQKQRNELIDKIRKQEENNQFLSEKLGEKNIMAETLRHEKELLQDKLNEKICIEQKICDKKLCLGCQKHMQEQLEEILFHKSENEKDITRQKRILEEEFHEIESKLHEKEVLLTEEKNNLLSELRSKTSVSKSENRSVKIGVSDLHAEKTISSVGTHCMKDHERKNVEYFRDQEINQIKDKLHVAQKKHRQAVKQLRTVLEKEQVGIKTFPEQKQS